MIGRLNRKYLWYLGIFFGMLILVWFGVFYYVSNIFQNLSQKLESEEKLLKEERISEDILKQFRAPDEEGREVPEDILEGFRAVDEKGKEIPEDILEGFRAK